MPVFDPMHAPALAIAWQLWRRHRWGLVSVLATLCAMSVVYPILLPWAHSESAVIISMIPVVYVLGYVLNIMIVADRTGDLGGGYPSRMFVLPVPTRTLAFWPMLYAVFAMFGLWLAIACLVYRPSGFATPRLLPALGLAATIAWLQVLSWSPFHNPWARIMVTVSTLMALIAAPFYLGVMGHVPYWGIVALLVSYFVPTYFLALAGLKRDRRGDVWEIRADWLKDWITNRAARRMRWQTPFRSAADAQLSYEWTCHGLYIPYFMGMMLMMLIGVSLVAPHRPADSPILTILLIILAIPPLLAGSQGAVIAQMYPFWAADRNIIRFVSVRPMRSNDLVFAKYRMAMRSVCLTWVLTLGLMMIWILLGGWQAEVVEAIRGFVAHHPGWRGPTILALTVLLMPVLTWKQMTDPLPPNLTGRRWIGDGIVYLGLFMFFFLLALGAWIQAHPERLAGALRVVPWLVVVTITLKVLISLWAFRESLRRDLLSATMLGIVLTAWVVLAACTIALVLLLAPHGTPWVSLPVMLLGAIGFVPLGRFALAPLALDRNRHQ